VTMPGAYVPAADVPAYFAAADALVLPYRSATASQNALIAFQFGLPVIASRAGAIADAVEDGVNGILCAPGDAGDLARAIRAPYAPGTLERLRAGVPSLSPGPLWDDYLAAMGKAISAGQSRAGEGRPGRRRPAAFPSAQRPLAAGAVPRPGGGAGGRGSTAGPTCGAQGRGPRCVIAGHALGAPLAAAA
jgi:hypothetical protein